MNDYQQAYQNQNEQASGLFNYAQELTGLYPVQYGSGGYRCLYCRSHHSTDQCPNCGAPKQ